MSKSVLGMNKPLSSSLKRPNDDIEKQQQHSVKLMQHQEEPAFELAQKLNQIIASDLTPTMMLQEIAKVLGVVFDVDCCCLVTVPTEVSNEVMSANWHAKEYSGLLPSEEVFTAMEQLDLPVMECASEPITIEDIATIQKSLVHGCQYLPLAKAVLSIPTRFGGKNNGVISLIKSQPYSWTESEKQLLQSVESSCAIAFSHVVQVQQIASQHKYLQTCAQHQNLIKQLTILSRSNWELNQMLQLALASTAETLGADRGLLILLKYTDPLSIRNNSKNKFPRRKQTLWVSGAGTKKALQQTNRVLRKILFTFPIVVCASVLLSVPENL